MKENKQVAKSNSTPPSNTTSKVGFFKSRKALLSASAIATLALSTGVAIAAGVAKISPFQIDYNQSYNIGATIDIPDNDTPTTQAEVNQKYGGSWQYYGVRSKTGFSVSGTTSNNTAYNLCFNANWFDVLSSWNPTIKIENNYLIFSGPMQRKNFNTTISSYTYTQQLLWLNLDFASAVSSTGYQVVGEWEGEYVWQNSAVFVLKPSSSNIYITTISAGSSTAPYGWGTLNVPLTIPNPVSNATNIWKKVSN